MTKSKVCLVREATLDGRTVKLPVEAYNVFKDDLLDAAQEVVAVLALATNGKAIDCSVLFKGGINSSILEPRVIFTYLLLQNAASFLVAHNHPSGNLEPSREDIYITERLKELGDLMQIPLQDHLIISSEGFISLAEQGLI